MLDKYIKNKWMKEIAEWLITIVAAIVLCLLLQQFVFRTADVSGDSMEPSFSHKDKIIINRMQYLFGDPSYNDVVVFPYKGNPKDYYIKRIIGKPNDAIDLKDNQFYINGEVLQDAFAKSSISALGDLKYPITVPEGSYFVLGDNRNGSKDSRYTEVGFIAKKDFIGKVAFRLWPLDKLGVVK